MFICIVLVVFYVYLAIYLKAGMVTKPGKVLCYVFAGYFEGLTQQKTIIPLSLCLTKIQKVVLCVNTTS